MGVNNKARRAAKRRKQRRAPQAQDTYAGSDARWFDGRQDDAHIADQLVLAALLAVRQDPRSAAEQAERLACASVPVRQVAAAVSRYLARVTAGVVRGCWTPSDLAEITRRQLSARHVPLVTALLFAETDRHPAATVAPAWRGELDALRPVEPPDLTAAGDLQLALDVACLLDQLPRLEEVIPPPGSPPRSAARVTVGAPAKVLAKVRALLAKAEATEFPDEAEALSAKAQELIATYALDRFAHQLDADEDDEVMQVRRVWIDPPYVLAKAMLANAVASANHCQSVLTERLGFVTLIGHPSHVEASELLVTSLLVQADRAMLRHGRLDDRWGRSRTTSFRRSFLVAYATRIGERLQRASDDTLAASGRSGELVPVMARVDARVRATTERLFPELVARGATASNGLGWAAGRAAADLALLDVHGAIADQAAS